MDFEIIAKSERGRKCALKQRRPVSWVEDGRGCWICKSHSASCTTMMYPSLTRNKRTIPVYKYMWELTNGRKSKTLCHQCDNNLCINPFHLREATQQDNMVDAVVRNRVEYGERHHNSKLSEDSVKEIHYMRGKAVAQKVADVYGVTESNIRSIWRGNTWNRVTGLPRVNRKVTNGM